MAAIIWLARDFRFSDNAALRAAAAEGPVLPVFVIDAALRAQGSASRWRLERALHAFAGEWEQRTGQSPTILQGEAEAVLPPLAAQIGAATIHQNDWPAPDQRAAQDRLARALAGTATRLRLHPGHLLVHPHRLRTGGGGAYRVFTPFARALRRLGPDRPGPEPARIAALPAIGPLRAADLALAPDMHRGAPVLARFALPTGEAAARARLAAFLSRAPAYASGRDRPDLDATSGLSEHLATGEISPRQLWAEVELCALAHPAAAAGIEAFLTELIWREFAWHLLIDFPAMAGVPWRAEWSGFPWRGDTPEAEAWRRGATGIPLVDAGLREMRVTGRMHNRVRMVAASWLTKHLLTDWRLGLAHFADTLTDWDPAANAMNWQWVAGCGPDAAPFFRIFNPLVQAQRFDPDGRYRRRWLDDASPEAEAYHATLPSGWRVPRPHAPAETEQRLAEGRARALAAHARHRAP